MIKIAVCDDNIPFAKYLTDKLRDICALKLPEQYQCQVAREMSSAQEVFDCLHQGGIDILFLDIDMPRENGFQLAQKVNALQPEIMILFVSSHDDLVFDSFEYHLFRFLRKSRLAQELEPALLKAVAQLTADTRSLILKTTEYGAVEVKVKDILFIQSRNNYYAVCGGNFEYKCRGTMFQAEALVRDFSFFRINSGCLVNPDGVLRFESPNRLILKDTVLYVSARRLAAFKEAYSRFTRKRVL